MQHTASSTAALRCRRIAPFVLLPLAYLAVATYQLVHLQAPPSASANAVSLGITTVQQATHVAPMIHRMRKAEDVDVTEAPTAAPTPAPTPTPVPTSAIIKGRRTRVLLVNFLDSKRCAETLKSLFETAKEPDLVRVSIHDQILEAKGDLTCEDGYCQLVGERHCRRSQIVTTKVDAKDAAGPTVARAITEKSIGDEEFCLGIDSHLVFVRNWDEDIIANWEATENKRAILTVYPKSTEYLTDHSRDHQMGLLCNGRIETPDQDAMIQYIGALYLDKTNETKPRLQSQFAGGFNFGSCQAYRDVPNDPYTPILFYGEEYARAARLWTWGYDMYAPSVDVVYHWFETRSKIWDDDWPKKHEIMMRSKRRVRFIMGLNISSDDFDHSELEKYGLGTKRSFDQWKNFSGIDPSAKFGTEFVNCGELPYVPFAES